MKAQTLVIACGAHGISQACTFNNVDGAREASFDEKMLTVANRRLAEDTAIVAFESGGEPAGSNQSETVRRIPGRKNTKV
jgi:hypothetical protein